ncbi:MAG: hypothetical protein J7M01_02835, partial [Candidatus Marinimicrobia bacterium]|nr:hypothetical protein [Candidatus Neomarinimicrobiota bacterium]
MHNLKEEYDMMHYMHYVSCHGVMYMDKYGDEAHSDFYDLVKANEQLQAYVERTVVDNLPKPADLVIEVFSALKGSIHSEELTVIACMRVINEIYLSFDKDEILKDESFFNRMTHLVLNTQEEVE